MNEERDRLARVVSRVCQLQSEGLCQIERLLDNLETSVHGELAGDARDVQRSVVHPIGQNASSEDQLLSSGDWPHAPVHRLEGNGTFMVTAGTLYKQHFFRDRASIDFLQSELLKKARSYDWQLEAWAVFSNHYHFVGHPMVDATSLKPFLTQLHNVTARFANQRDSEPDRQVWFNYWDTALTYPKAYQARLKYVHFNAVKHRLVSVANQYPWCSAAWFERTATRAQVKTIYSYKIDKVKVFDDFEPIVIE